MKPTLLELSSVKFSSTTYKVGSQVTHRVLLTRGLSTVRTAIDLIHQAMQPAEFHLAASYSTLHTPLRLVADSFYLEPGAMAGEAYADWLLTLCQTEQFAVVWPQSHWGLLLEQRQRFSRAGVQLLLPCPDPATLAAIQDKAQASLRLATAEIALPLSFPFSTAEEFSTAQAALTAQGRRTCVKPARSIYGLGFRLIDEGKSPLDRFLANDIFAISSAEFQRLLDVAPGPRAFLAMEYLAGDEYSMDCLAQQGRLVRAVIRRKPADSRWRWQQIEANPTAWAIAERVVAAFQLDGLVNVQTRERVDAEGRREQCFLEVNPRMSGGIFLSCQSGLNLPYWFLRLAMGTVEASAIPWPATGLRVAKIEQAVTLPAVSTVSPTETPPTEPN